MPTRTHRGAYGGTESCRTFSLTPRTKLLPAEPYADGLYLATACLAKGRLCGAVYFPRGGRPAQRLPGWVRPAVAVTGRRLNDLAVLCAVGVERDVASLCRTVKVFVRSTGAGLAA